MLTADVPVDLNDFKHLKAKLTTFPCLPINFISKITTKSYVFAMNKTQNTYMHIKEKYMESCSFQSFRNNWMETKVVGFKARNSHE